MSARHSTPTRSNRAIAVVIALIVSLLVLVSPNLESKADYTSVDTSAIKYNDRVCNLGDPNDHTTSATAFEISTSEQLWEITDCVSNSATIYFELGDDIDVSDASKAGSAPTNSPIGFSTSAVAYSFSGVLDGKNRTISGLDMSSSDYGVGLFNYLHDATISNLVIAGSLVTNTSATGTSHAAGGLAIRADGTLYLASIRNQASVTGNINVGGLVGYVKGVANIIASSNTRPISGGSYVGGLVGFSNEGLDIHSSYNSGLVSGKNGVGGLTGWVNFSNIHSSYNAGTVSGSNSVGGFTGVVVGAANINSFYNTGAISGATDVDGIAGSVWGGPVTTTSAYSSVDSLFVATTPVADMRLASTFVGFDNAVWGFGSVADNQGFPMLRVFAELSSYSGDFPQFSSNSELASLEISQGTLSPNFAAGTLTYTASVANGISSITLTPTSAEAGAAITVQGVAVSSANASGAISLDVGSNTVEIVVTAADLTITTYTITITRAAAASTPSHTSTGPIVYNDRVCNLGDPNDHTTSATAFEISTSEQLWEITDCVSSSATIYFKLGDDIDVSDASKAGSASTNSPIGFSTSALAYSFSGVLDGKNKTISGLDMSSSDYGVGLFNYLHDATISNLVIAGSFVTTITDFLTKAEFYAAGALTMVAKGTLNLSSISNQASVSGHFNVGGLVGYASNDANIDSSYNSGAVSGDSRVGGLVGLVDKNANVNSSYNTGTVSGDVHVGGLVGIVGGDNANIDSSYNTGNVLGPNYAVGGLVGYASNDANIDSSYNTGAVSGSYDVGGLVGHVDNDANITSSYNTGTVSVTADYVGGLVGLVYVNANIISSYNTGAVSGSNQVGGLVGWVDEYAFITSSYNTGAVSGTSDFDGLVGGVRHTVTTISAYSSVQSMYVDPSTIPEMQLASTYIGFDFSSANPVWGFGTCNENGGYPMLRIFAGVATFYPTACYTAPQSETPASSIPAPIYSGPMIDQAQSVQQGSEVTFNGRRLETVTAVYVGGVEVSISSTDGQSLVLVIASSMPPGTHDLVLRSSMGTLTFQNGITVLEAQTELVAKAAPETLSLQRLTVGSFKGFIAIYTKGYEGQRLSAKVAGKWLVVSSLDETWSGNNYSRTIRSTGAGEAIQVHLYIDRQFVRTEELNTK